MDKLWRTGTFVYMYFGFALGSQLFTQMKDANEVKTWANANGGSVRDIKFDPLIPGNLLLATRDGLVTTDGTTLDVLVTSYAKNFVQIGSEITLTSVTAEHCIQQFMRVSALEVGPVDEYGGNCSAPGYNSGPLPEAEFNQPVGLLVSNGGRNILLADRKNNLIRSINIENKTIDSGINIEHYPNFLAEHPSDPDLILATIAHGVIVVNLKYETFSLLAGSLRVQDKGFVDGFRPDARFQAPDGMVVIDGDLIIAESSPNQAIRYISNITTQTSGTVETLCKLQVNETQSNMDGNFTNCRLNNPRNFLYDGVRMMFGSGRFVKYIGPAPNSGMYTE